MLKTLVRNPTDASFPAGEAETAEIQDDKSGPLATKLLDLLSEYQRMALSNFYRSQFITSSSFEQ